MSNILEKIDYFLESLKKVSEQKESDNQKDEELSDEEIKKLKEGGLL